ncbi:MAG: macro domain-containing protein [Firmicutes bacterium]|nr:macro domain-containing protein [Bacillota bacterium]
MIKIMNGNLLESGAEVICHQVNCKGAMDAGIAKQIKIKYPKVFEVYQKVCADAGYDHAKLLGTICDVPVEKGKNSLIICNLFGQDNYQGSGFCFTDYNALRAALEKVKENHGNKKIALPYRMSCSLAGGDWRVVEEIILDAFGNDCDVTIYRMK